MYIDLCDYFFNYQKTNLPNSCYEKACSFNNSWGCKNVGGLYAQGLGVKQDYIIAKDFFEKGCSLNEGTGCTNLGALYAKGQGIKQDYITAKEYYGKACDYNDQNGCDNYARLNKAGY